MRAAYVDGLALQPRGATPLSRAAAEEGPPIMSRSPRISRLLLAFAIAVSSSTGVLAVATPAYAVSSSEVIATARDEVGTPEGSARADSYGAAVNLYDSTHNYAWCAVFVSWVMERTGA